MGLNEKIQSAATTREMALALYEDQLKTSTELGCIVAQLLEALEAAEWGGSIDGWSCCSVCGGVKGDAFDDGSRYGAHSPDCILAVAIKKAREG